MSEKHFAMRRIRKGGLVKVGKVWYHPDEQWLKYDGRLDGLVFLFGRYLVAGEYLPLLNCWGIEHNAKESDVTKWIPDPQEVDGTIPWMFWKPIDKRL